MVFHTLGMQGHSEPNRELLDAAALCRHLVPEGTVEAFLADHRQELFPDEMFADLFPSGRGRPSVPADVMATVLVLQALEGLSDREQVPGQATDRFVDDHAQHDREGGGRPEDVEGQAVPVEGPYEEVQRASEQPSAEIGDPGEPSHPSPSAVSIPGLTGGPVREHDL